MAMELKTTGVNGFVKPAELTNMETLLNAVNDELLTGKGAGSDFLGWLDLPVNYDKEEFARIQQAAKKIQGDSDVLVVIGIGGSYLGARAAIEFCKGQMYNGVREKGIPEIYFVGNNISSSYINDVVKIIGDRDFSVNIISKSGDCFPRVQEDAGRKVWRRRREGPHLCHDRQGARRIEESGERRGLRVLRRAG